MNKTDPNNTALILGNSNSRFSGVTSTMLEVLKHQKSIMPLTVMGKHHISDSSLVSSFWEITKLCRTLLPNGKKRIFHARRNDEMIQALILRFFFGAQLHVVFTSTAQRHHSLFTRWLMKQMDGIITTCDAANSYLKEPADIISPHGVDTLRYHPADDKEKSWTSLKLPGKYGIGIFGRVRKQKGHDILIDALIPLLEKYPDWTLVVVGELKPKDKLFWAEQELKISSKQLQDRVVFLGKQPFDKIPKLFRSMSLVTALSRSEGFGLTVLEAMASGVPVIASQAGAWNEIIRTGKDGIIVPINDVSSTQNALSSLLQRPENLSEMGLEARNHITKNFSIEQEARVLCQYFKSLQEK